MVFQYSFNGYPAAAIAAIKKILQALDELDPIIALKIMKNLINPII